MTAYTFTKLVNAHLKESGILKELPPQMFYTYFKKDYVKVEDRTPEGAIAWVTKYIKKHEDTLTRA